MNVNPLADSRTSHYSHRALSSTQATCYRLPLWDRQHRLLDISHLYLPLWRPCPLSVPVRGHLYQRPAPCDAFRHHPPCPAMIALTQAEIQ